MMLRADHPAMDRGHELASPPVIEVRLHPPILLQILWPPLREQESSLETGCKALLNSRDFDGADNDLFHFQLPHVIPDGHPRRSDGLARHPGFDSFGVRHNLLFGEDRTSTRLTYSH